MATTRKAAAQRTAEPEPTPAAQTVTVEEPAKKKETVQQLKNRLRNEAEREVLNKHKDEVIEITQAKYDEHGLEYVRRLTDAEKAQKEVLEKLEQYPELEAYIAARIAKHGESQVLTEIREADIYDATARRAEGE